MRSTRLKRKSTKTIIRDFFRNAEKEKKGERKERRKKRKEKEKGSTDRQEVRQLSKYDHYD
jgi:hypothetical protein